MQCTVIDDLGPQLIVRYKGVTTTFEKAEIKQVKHLSQRAVDMKMRRMSLEQAIRLVDRGLVPYGDDWITPEERDIKKQKVALALQKAETEAQREKHESEKRRWPQIVVRPNQAARSLPLP